MVHTAVARDGRLGTARVTRTLLVVWLALAGALLPVSRTPQAVGRVVSAIVVERGPAAQVAQRVASLGGRVTARLDAVQTLVVRIPLTAVAALATDPAVVSVTPDSTVHLNSIGNYDPTSDTGSLYNTTLMTGAQAMWQAGYTGQGVTVALIDTGVAPVNGLDAPGKVYNGADVSFESQAANLTYLDTYGHGTHMAGIIAGRDDGTKLPYAGNTSNFIGMAPNASILNMKVADAHGATDVSQIIASLDWVMQHRNDNGMNVRVVNLSFGSDSVQSYLLDPLAHAVEDAWRDGIVVVASTGNAGFKLTGIDDPAEDPYVIAVGAANTNGTDTYADDTVATFSQTGDGARDPDVLAPGVHIASLRDPGSYIDLTYGSTGDVSGTGRLFRGSGTSQATAVVSGAVALLLSEHPDLNPDQVKRLLTSTATSLSLVQPATAQGSGEINLNAAMTAPEPNATTSTQVWDVSTGTGSLQGSRGDVYLSMNGVALQGEVDIMGQPVDTVNLAATTDSLSSWTGGAFNGNTWTGNTWTGNTWTDASWSGNTWTGNTWTSVTWSGNTWTGNTWTGNTWTGNDWTGNTWTGNTWSNAAWN